VGHHLDANTSWFFSMASSRLSLGLEHGGHQMLGSDGQGLFDPEHRKNAKVGQHTQDDKDFEGANNTVNSSKYTSFLSRGNP
jgi:hypothetical protein